MGFNGRPTKSTGSHQGGFSRGLADKGISKGDPEMTHKPYYRDIWCLGTGTGYPGSFPRGLVDRVLKRWNGEKKLMLFSGNFHKLGWDTLDIKPENHPTFTMNAEGSVKLSVDLISCKISVDKTMKFSCIHK